MDTGKKILITGASGSLGKQLIYEFSRCGCHPIAHVRENSDTTFIDSLGLQKRVADLRNREQLAALVDGVDGVIHTAAWVSFRQDRLTQFTGINTFAAVELFKAAQKAGVQRFVHVSSVVSVGAIRRANGDEASRQIGTVPQRVSETDEFNLGHLRIPYIMTKHAADVELRKLAADGTTELVTVNPSTIVAPSRTGDDRAKALKMFSRIAMPGFHNRVNLVDIRDVAPGVIAALERGKAGERYILAGDNITARELVLTVSQVLGKIPHVMRIPRRFINLFGRVAPVWARLTGKGKIKFYPDLVKMLDYDWAYASGKARRELGYRNRSIFITLDDLLNNRFIGTYLKPAPLIKSSK